MIRFNGVFLSEPINFEQWIFISIDKLFENWKSKKKNKSDWKLWVDDMGRTVLHWAFYHQVKEHENFYSKSRTIL
jgi:hypothetical protein